jgi:LysM domain
MPTGRGLVLDRLPARYLLRQIGGSQETVFGIPSDSGPICAPGGGSVGFLGDLFGKKERPRPDFSNVRSGGSSTAAAPGAGGPEEGATSVTTGRTYVVVSGDSLSKIAKHQYGDAQKWSRIYEANRNIIKNPDLIYPGQELRIPEA